MPEKQLAILRIENLNVEQLTKALTNYGVEEEVVKFFASRGITGSNLLRLNTTNVLQWRCEIGIAKCNKFQKVVERIQRDPENFVSQALDTSDYKQLEIRKPLPNPRPVNLIAFTKRNKDSFSSDSNESKKEKATDEHDGKDELDEELMVKTVDLLFNFDDEESMEDELISPAFNNISAGEDKDYSVQPNDGRNTVQNNKTSLENKTNVHFKEINAYNSSTKTKITSNKSNDSQESIPGFMNVTSTEAENVLNECPNGTYLIRPSSIFYCTLVIKHENIVYNVGISYDSVGKVFKFNLKNPCKAFSFASVPQLIQHFKQNPMYLQESESRRNIVLFLKEPVTNKMN